MAGYVGNLAAAGAGQTVNTLTLILSDSDNMLLFTALLLLPGSDKAGWQKSTGRRGSGGVAGRSQVELTNEIPHSNRHLSW